MTEQSQWNVRPHGQLTPVDDGLWVVDGEVRMPPGPLPRRMTIALLSGGELVVFSAIALAEAEMAKVEALGRPAFLVVPNGWHRLDAAGWKARYPGMVVVAPAGARAQVEEVVRVDDTSGDFGDGAVRFMPVPGTAGEAALVVRRPAGTTLVINDLIGNVQDARGIMKLALVVMGFGGRRPQVPRAFKARAVTDAAAVAGRFREWAALPDLRRIVVSHGAIIEAEAAGVLRRLAEGLAPAKR
ncbi:MAG TPA: hypothetical protein VGN80_01065 [Devosiaceae bacterium]|jgi:hypothetical protein|nr:hypothetical protein [Devosiaceae bacterium]